MKLTALVTTFVLGISSAAIAAPSYGRPSQPATWKPAPTAPVIRDHRVVRPAPRAWKTLATSKLNGRQTFNVNSAMRYSTLKLEAARGTTFVDKVLITFANGRTQLVSVGKNLNLYSPTMIDLAGDSRHITKIQVLGKGGFRSSYKILAA